MRQVSQNTLIKYRELINLGLFKETELVSFRSLLNNTLRHDEDIRDELLLRFNTVGCTLEFEQQAKGLQWLLNFNLKKNRTPRATCFLGDFELSVLEKYVAIKVSRLDNVGHGIYSNLTPVYRVLDTAGNWFEYRGTEVTDIGQASN